MTPEALPSRQSRLSKPETLLEGGKSEGGEVVSLAGKKLHTRLDDALNNKEISEEGFASWRHWKQKVALESDVNGQEVKLEAALAELELTLRQKPLRQEMVRQMHEEMTKDGAFSSKERQDWIKAAADIESKLERSELTAEQAFMQLQNLLGLIPTFRDQGKGPLKLYYDFSEQLANNSSMELLVLRPGALPKAAEFSELSFQEKKTCLKGLADTLDEEFGAFEKRYPIFCGRDKNKKREVYKKAKTITQKFEQLRKIKNSMEKGEEMIEIEKKEAAHEIKSKKLSEAKERLDRLYKKLDPDTVRQTFQHYGMDTMWVEGILKPLGFKSDHLTFADRFEKTGNFPQAIAALQKAQDIEPDPQLPVRIRNLTQRQQARETMDQAKVLAEQRKEEDKEQILKLARAAVELDATLQPELDILQKQLQEKPKEQKTKEEAAKEELIRMEKTPEFQVMRQKARIVEYVRRKTQEQGQDTSDQKSGSVLARATEGVEDASQRAAIQRSVEKNTTQLDNSQLPEQQKKENKNNVVKLFSRKQQERREDLDVVARDLLEGRRRLDSFTLQNNEEDNNTPVSINAWLYYLQEEMAKRHQANVAMIEQQHGVTLASDAKEGKPGWWKNDKNEKAA